MDQKSTTSHEENYSYIMASDSKRILVMQAALEAVRAILLEQTEFLLPPQQWEAFYRRLDAPPQTVPALRRLFAEPEPFDT